MASAVSAIRKNGVFTIDLLVTTSAVYCPSRRGDGLCIEDFLRLISQIVSCAAGRIAGDLLHRCHPIANVVRGSRRSRGTPGLPFASPLGFVHRRISATKQVGRRSRPGCMLCDTD